MNELLAFAIEAHGGLERWRNIEAIEAKATIGGALWEWKGLPNLFANKSVLVVTGEQRVEMAPIEDGVLVYTPSAVWLEDGVGNVLARREDPAASFVGQTQSSPWDVLHAACFNGRALWTYLNQPFLYASPGFSVEEIEPWAEDGETWRSLLVTFPDGVVSHTRSQITRFGPDGLIRRHDYSVDLLGGAGGVNYVSGYREVDGLMLGTRRKVYPRDEAMRRLGEPLLVSIDLHDLRMTKN